jgi:hypothetical protein
MRPRAPGPASFELPGTTRAHTGLAGRLILGQAAAGSHASSRRTRIPLTTAPTQVEAVTLDAAMTRHYGRPAGRNPKPPVILRSVSWPILSTLVTVGWLYGVVGQQARRDIRSDDATSPARRMIPPVRP